MPLTNSLYVPGKLSDLNHVIVDVGTGYFVKKVRKRACGQSIPLHLTFIAHLIIYLHQLDACPSSKALRSKSGIYPYQSRHTGRDNTKKTGQYELLDQCDAVEVASSNEELNLIVIFLEEFSLYVFLSSNVTNADLC